MHIILASASPRRKELLERIGWEFEICVSQVEEKITGMLPEEIVEELSRQKAEDVFERVSMDQTRLSDQEYLVIGADTIVVCSGQILGKPKDRKDAVRMISLLQGTSHDVYTGVTLVLGRNGRIKKSSSFFEKTQVDFYPMTQEEIEAYADSREPMDKAGGYGIQGLCARYIKGIRGDYNNVVGLPAGRVYQEAKLLIG